MAKVFTAVVAGIESPRSGTATTSMSVTVQFNVKVGTRPVDGLGSQTFLANDRGGLVTQVEEALQLLAARDAHAEQTAALVGRTIATVTIP